MMPEARTSVSRRLQTWLWTGPIGHLVGGALDLAQALLRHRLRRMRGRRRRER